MLISIETYRTCDFPGREGQDPLSTSLDPRMIVFFVAYQSSCRGSEVWLLWLNCALVSGLCVFLAVMIRGI